MEFESSSYTLAQSLSCGSPNIRKCLQSKNTGIYGHNKILILYIKKKKKNQDRLYIKRSCAAAFQRKKKKTFLLV